MCIQNTGSMHQNLDDIIKVLVHAAGCSGCGGHRAATISVLAGRIFTLSTWPSLQQRAVMMLPYTSNVLGHNRHAGANQVAAGGTDVQQAAMQREGYPCVSQTILSRSKCKQHWCSTVKMLGGAQCLHNVLHNQLQPKPLSVLVPGMCVPIPCSDARASAPCAPSPCMLVQAAAQQQPVSRQLCFVNTVAY